MRKLFRKIREKRFRYKSLVEVFIYKENLLHNLNEFRKLNTKVDVAPVLKSNAYGHGLIEIAKILDTESIPFLVVDSFYEAMILRNEGIKSEILIIGYSLEENILNNKLKNIAFTIGSLEQLENISKNLKTKTNFHIKFDTGMHRNGILDKEIEKTIILIKNNKNIFIEGICSHFADADGDDSDFTTNQIEKWNNLVEIWKKNFPETIYYHISATAGSLFADSVNANLMRLGIGLYGINTSLDDRLNLKPVLEMKSVISSIKEIKKGDKIGYNTTFTAEKNMKIATVPVGYYEGVDRRLSNNGFLKIQNKFCPILGMVSMNITTIDVSDIEQVKIGDEVVIISSKSADENSVIKIAQKCATIPYEILVHIPERLKRIVI
ncbi:MAG: alanine racemase [Parcubacteria group bacterium Athens0714_16]|nr:MAG: alanine racemase [Parcubacteria group bacterium Athens0714_16]